MNRATRFWSHVRRDASGCWLWTGAEADGTGYGVFNSGDGSIGAHVFAFELANPGVDRRGQVVRHTCDVKLCVNPKHLAIGTQRDNVADMDRRGRRVSNPRRGEAHVNSKLTAESVIEARKAYAAGASIRSLARLYGVTSPTMTSALRGKTWRST